VPDIVHYSAAKFTIAGVSGLKHMLMQLIVCTVINYWIDNTPRLSIPAALFPSKYLQGNF